MEEFQGLICLSLRNTGACTAVSRGALSEISLFRFPPEIVNKDSITVVEKDGRK